MSFPPDGIIGEITLKRQEIREWLAERKYKEAPGWACYSYVPFREAPEIVREQYLRKADEELLEYQKTWGNDGEGFYDCFRPTKPRDLYKAGYTLTAPLIEEG